MKYSVLIPAYNCADLIAETVESIRYCGLEDYEILVVNDGSTDGTARVLEELQLREPALVVLTQPNGGVSAARNLAIAHARGEYLVFVDADDRLAEDCYRRAAGLIEEHRPDMLLFGMRIEHCREGVCYWTQQLVCPREGLLTAAEWPSQLDTLFRCNYLSPIWNKIIRRRLVTQNGIRFRQEMFLLEDCRFSLDCLQASDTVYLLPEAVYSYQMLDDGKKADARVRRIQSLNAYMEHFAGFSPLFSGIIREIYFMLLAQRVRSASGISQLRAELQEYQASPYFQDSVTLENLRLLREERFGKILQLNRYYNLRHRAVVFYKLAKRRHGNR